MRNHYYRFLSSLAVAFDFLYKNRLRVLAYHDVKNLVLFEKQIQYLNTTYNVISIEEIKKYCFENTPLPPNSLLITFDDGDISVLRKGLPVLSKYHIPSVLFVITDLINTQKEFWWSKVRNQGETNIEKINARMKYLKELPNSARLIELKKYNNSPQEQLKTEDLKSLKRNNVFIGNHSHTHPMFNRCTEQELTYELEKSKACFKTWNMEGFEIFAYPNGNFDNATEKALKKHNVKMAFLFDHKINEKIINPYRISRIRTNSDMSINELKVKVSGLHSFLQKLKN